MTNELWTTATGVLLAVAGVVGAFGADLVGAMAVLFMFLGGFLVFFLPVNESTLFFSCVPCVCECVVVGNVP